MDDVDVDTPHRPRHRVAWTLGGLVAVVVGIVVAVDVGAGRSHPSPSPTTDLLRRSVTADQETAVVYVRWQEAVAYAACLGDQGYPVEPYPASETARGPRIAAFLGVAPLEPTTWLAPGFVRNALVVPGVFGTADEGGPTRNPAAALGACPASAAVVDTSDAAAVSRAVEAALADHGFQAYLAEALWMDEHPVEAVLISSRPLLSSRPGADDGTWQQRLDRVLGLLTAEVSWTTDGSEAYATFAQAVGHVAGGAAIIVRVAGTDQLFASYLYTGRTDPVDCGGVLVGVGYPLSSGFGAQESASLDDVVAALTDGACAVLG